MARHFSSAANIMKMEPKPSDRELLAGLVERVTYQNAENGFCVIRVKARGHRELITVVGHAAAISAGEWITAAGDWVNDRTHGQQFKARFLKTSAPTSVEGIEKYLASGMIRGIGPVYAKKLLRARRGGSGLDSSRTSSSRSRANRNASFVSGRTASTRACRAANLLSILSNNSARIRWVRCCLCPFIGVKRSCRLRARNDANDPN